MCAMKMYEEHHGLTEIYGANWSWSSILVYKQTDAALKECTKSNKLNVSLEKTDFSAAFMSDDQWKTLHEYTWQCFEDTSLNFLEHLQHKVAFLSSMCCF